MAKRKPRYERSPVQYLDPRVTELPPLLDEVNPESLASVMSGERFAEAVAALPKQYLALGERELTKKIKPTRVDWALRVSLWNEYRKAALDPLKAPSKVKSSQVYSGICGRDHWYWILKQPERVAWLILPFKQYEMMLEPLLYRAIDCFEDILNMPIYDEKGRPNPSAAKVVAQVAARIEDRLRGTPMQRQASLNVNYNSAAKPTTETSDPSERMKELDRELAELREAERIAQHLPPALKATSNA